jgi:hypothetical protein
MHRGYLLIVTAFGEGGTGLLALVSPSVLLALLLGIDHTSPEASFFGRIAGAALLGIGVASWLGRSHKDSAAQFALLSGLLTYDMVAAVILAYTGLFENLTGIALWPAVVLHAALAIWCFLCLRAKPHDQDVGSGANLKTMSRSKEANG